VGDAAEKKIKAGGSFPLVLLQAKVVGKEPKIVYTGDLEVFPLVLLQAKVVGFNEFLSGMDSVVERFH